MRRTTPDAPIGHAPRPATTDGTARSEYRAGKIPPWHRRATTASAFRRFPTARTLPAAGTFAMAEVSDPSPVPAEADTRRPDANPEVADSFLATCRQENLQKSAKKPVRCDLLHKRLLGDAVNHRNGRENTPIIVRFPGRHRHRLCLDRHRGRCCPDRADLSDPDLNPRRAAVEPIRHPCNGYALHRERFRPRRNFPGCDRWTRRRRSKFP